jgi:HD superfamily phosphodiesterase
MAGISAGIKISDSKIAREAAELLRQHETEMLYNHSARVFVFGAMKGVRQNLKFDSELRNVAALFHDVGLVDAYHTDTKRFEVDGEILLWHPAPSAKWRCLCLSRSSIRSATWGTPNPP